ncbi:MAG: hypothetical protein RI559_10170 [Marinospirillum sp.]|nr:hypothetical protein [Marinospirillum sp.]
MLFAAFLVVTLSGCKSDSNSVELVESEVESQVENEIQNEFNDPADTRFRKGSFSSYDPETLEFIGGFIPEATSFMFCGEVNGKNRYGSFSGFKKFAALYSPPLDADSGPDIDVTYEGNHQFKSISKDCP